MGFSGTRKGGKDYVLVLDEGTTGTKAFVFDEKLNIVSRGYQELTLYSTSDGRAELDSEEIFLKSVEVCRDAIRNAGIGADQIACMGIDAQRSTMVVWEKDTGKPYERAISWQDTRVGFMTERLQRDGMLDFVFRNLGRSVARCSLFLVKWMCENIEGFHQRLVKGDLLYGSVDTWLVYRLTGGRSYRTSIDHAALNGMADIHHFALPEKLFDYLELPVAQLPEVKDNADFYGVTEKSLFGAEIPITGVIADQHASLFAQRVIHPGDCKCTNGTGAFIDLSIGHQSRLPTLSHSILLTWRLRGAPSYVAECYAMTTGTFQRWLKKLFGLKSYREIDELAASAPDSQDVLVLPVLFGLIHPKRDSGMRGMILGLSESCGREHIMRATLEGIAFLIRYISSAMAKDLGIEINDMRIDGGLASSDIFCDILASVVRHDLKRPSVVELTALGAAEIAGMQKGLWDESAFDSLRQLRVFSPQLEAARRYEKQFDAWRSALERAATV
ncbi:MAG: hypothetical protein LBD04_05475 [Synergistaceae bacterium]|nr:hypothetical protein [Synergistaceae bacterium]